MSEDFGQPTGSVPSDGTFFKAWIVFTLVSIVGAFFAGAAGGFVVGMVLGVAGFPIETVQLVCAVLGLLLGLLTSFVTFKWLVTKFLLNR